MIKQRLSSLTSFRFITPSCSSTKQRTMKDLQQLFDDDDTNTKSSILSKNGKKTTNIIDFLEEEKGWDITQNRLYLGFSPLRIQWTIKDE